MSASVNGGSTTTYVYNALGQRVEKTVWSTYTAMAYDATGRLMNYNNGTYLTEDFLWMGDRLIGIYVTGTRFLHPNALGSTGVLTTYDYGEVTQDALYYPWGQSWNELGTVEDERFAGMMKRDAETGLDPTANRLYASQQGRWLSPDPLAGHTEDPQTLNRYAYVRNSPTTLTDPSGLDFYLACVDPSHFTCVEVPGSGSPKGLPVWVEAQPSVGATVVTSASLSDPNSGNAAVVNASGVQITTAQGTFEGIFINGTPSATIQGDPKAAGWSDLTFNVFGSDVEHGNLDYGTATYEWSSNQSDVISALNKMGPFSYPLENSVGNPKHPGEINFRFSTGEYPMVFNYGPSLHLLVRGDPRATVPVGPGYVVGFHVDAQTGILSHGACAWLGLGCQ